jgi:hypothetical protein
MTALVLPQYVDLPRRDLVFLDRIVAGGEYSRMSATNARATSGGNSIGLGMA